MERDWAVLRIDEHRMWVGLTIKEPEGEECTQFSEAFIERYLRENGITAGINMDAIHMLVSHLEYGREVIVAQGREAIKGQDGFYQYTVMLEDARSKPTVNPDGSVDYYNSLKLAMVREGDLIAAYVPPTPGEYGFTVFSEMIPPVKGKELRPIRGTGFTVSEDGREYRAKFDGRIYKDNARIIVEKIYIIRGDLDLEQGNIRFNGDVEVKGDVRSGLMIEAEGNIFVHGHVGSCKLTAGHNITIRKGIQGKGRCLITAGGDVACSFVERCRIEAQGNVYADSVLDSEISARNRVIVSSRKGLVLGGVVSGMQGVTVKESGNAAETATVLRAGMVKEEVKRVSELTEKHCSVAEEVELLDRNLKLYDNLEGSKRTKETEATRIKILRAKVIKMAEQKKLEDELAALNAEIELARSEANIRIRGICYAGTIVNIGSGRCEIRESCKDVEFRFRLNEIVMLAGDDEE